MSQRLTRFCRPALTACFVALGTAASAQATQDQTPPVTIEEVEQAWQSGDFASARAGLEVLAKTNPSGLTTYRLGRMLLLGSGGPKDPEAAIAWLEQAVAQNNLPAHVLLARALLSTPAPLGDSARAVALFSNAAARGNSEAQYYLGLIYKAGKLVKGDPVAAFNWLLAASENQYAPAQYELGQLYLAGTGTAQNPAEAMRWVTRAANNEVSDAQYALAQAYETGTGVGQSSAKALEWIERAAGNGHALAQRNLGTQHLQGINGGAPNAALAERLLQSAAQAGDPGAMNNLAFAYLQGTVLPQNDTLALRYYEAASERKLGRATLALAGMIQAGRGTAANLKEAVALYELAAAQGEQTALDRITALALSGRLDADFAPQHQVDWIARALQGPQSAQAIAWLQRQSHAGVRDATAAYGAWALTQGDRAAEGFSLTETAAFGGDTRSQYLLGQAYSTGAGAELDYVKAYAWLNVAAASGLEKAGETRGVITDLMTPDQVAKGQVLSRDYFERIQAQVPQTKQTVTKQNVTQRTVTQQVSE